MVRVAVATLFVSVSAFGLSFVQPTPLSADALPVTQDAVFTVNGQELMITRSGAITAQDIATLAQPAPDCTAPCIAPMMAAQNVPTLGELDVITFLTQDVESGTGLLVDARLPNARPGGAIPAAINIPALTIAPANPYRGDILQALGAQAFEGIYNFDQAFSLVIFDNGPASTDAVTMINDLLDAGYPAEKLAYYRGGMQVWSGLGLSTQEVAQ